MTLEHIDASQLGGVPRHIDSIEWFASPYDLVATLAALNAQNDPTTKQILAINPGIAPGEAARWRYLGYKGGSEAGVISMSMLGQRKDGQWVAISGTWNNPAAPVDDTAFALLMTRLAQQAAH